MAYGGRPTAQSCPSRPTPRAHTRHVTPATSSPCYAWSARSPCIKTIKIPPRCPRANGYAERFLRTARTELIDRMLILNQRHLNAVLAEYVQHYNSRRPHRSRELRPPRPTHPAANLNSQRIKRQRLLGGLINEYERAV
ncbi:integrase core domain-containing protein [Kutzneria sp. NPDC051319]|uniref:integrase core domain-containing protein n=1 Tax=Kutzneria sp. NPDC051319 TaxID=3155047 RepID=UPI0034147021